MNFSILHMTVEYLEQPIQVDTPKPRFGWWLEGEENGLLQSAYQIVVKERNAVVWDSGKCSGDIQFHVEYQGTPLKPETSYTWDLTVWDQDKSSVTKTAFFETALFTDDISGFEGAKWIGSNTLPLYPDALSVFQIRSKFAILPGYTKAGFLFGGDDPRLMKSFLNLQKVENAEGESYIRLELDLSGLETKSKAVVNAYRAGYTKEDCPDTPLYSAEIPDGLLNEQNCHEPHELILYSEFGQLELYLDFIDVQHQLLGPSCKTFLLEMNRRWNLNPCGRGGDYIAFPVLGKIGTYEERKGSVSFDYLEVRSYRQPENILWHGLPEETNRLIDITSSEGNVMLRSSFLPVQDPKQLKKARIYATARGIYNLYLNGKKVGNDFFAPGFSQYDQHQFYQVYDVTSQIRFSKTRQQCLGVVLAEGWFCGAISYMGKNWNYYGDRNSLLLKLVLEYEDGTREVLVTDPDTWKMSQNGPILAASLFQGTRMDLRREWILKDFTKPDFDASAWCASEEILCDETTCCLKEPDDSPLFGLQKGLNYEHTVFSAQPDPGVNVGEVFPAVSMTEPKKGIYIYNMGQNIAGIARITLQGKEGQEVRVRYAEVLYPDLEEYEENAGMLMLENIRAALATDTFILRDGLQTIYPLFTWHGFQYLEITGIDHPLDPGCVEGLALSSLSEVSASIKTSNQDINRLYENITWSLRDNFLSIPSDCPQRNERMGWSGDLSVFGRSAVSMSLCSPFLTRHMTALKDTRINGRFADIAPLGGGFGGILWGSAGITIPWELYLQYGNKRILEEMYDSMFAYLKHLESRKDENGIVKEGPLGDWLGPENSRNEAAFLWQCYYIYDLEIVRKSAEILGKKNDLSWLLSEYSDAQNVFIRNYLDPGTWQTVYSGEDAAMSLNSPFTSMLKPRTPDLTSSGRYLMDTQTSYAVSVMLASLDETQKEQLGLYLRNACTRTNIDDSGRKCSPYTLMTGFIGTSWISQALSDTGHHDIAWRMIKSTDYPSWLYPVKNGATTIWERLNSYTREDGFGGNNSMNSFNHYSFGAVAAWMLSYAGGIRRTGLPGSFCIHPIPDPDKEISWADTSMQTVSGTYRVLWKQTDTDLTYQFHIPGGKKTPVLLPCSPAQKEKLLQSLSAYPTISEIRYDGKELSFTALPGTYTIGDAKK